MTYNWFIFIPYLLIILAKENFNQLIPLKEWINNKFWQFIDMLLSYKIIYNTFYF